MGWPMLSGGYWGLGWAHMLAACAAGVAAGLLVMLGARSVLRCSNLDSRDRLP